MATSDTRIRGRSLEDVFSDGFGDDRSELHFWLMMDTWSYETAMWLLAGVIPTQIYEGFGFHKVEGGLVGDEKSDRIAQIESLTRLWLSDPSHPKTAAPQVYFDWAEQKNLHIYWHAGAREWGYFKAIPHNYGRRETTKEEAAVVSVSSETPELSLINSMEDFAEKPLMPRERASLLNIIAVMLELLKSPKPGRNSDAAVIQEMIDNYPEKQGIAKRTLEEKFAAANKNLKEK